MIQNLKDSSNSAAGHKTPHSVRKYWNEFGNSSYNET